MKAPIAVALDAPDLQTAKSWAKEVSPYVSTLKIGLENYLRDGKSSIEEIRKISDCEIFLDLKLHDIPATVAGACRSVADLNPKYLTVHASGGAEMINEAVKTLPNTLIVAVTILTLVCSPQEVSEIRINVDPSIVLITPGVRPIGSNANDQQRIATPEEALLNGANLLVIGRPITGSDNVSESAKKISEEVNSVKL